MIRMGSPFITSGLNSLAISCISGLRRESLYSSAVEIVITVTHQMPTPVKTLVCQVRMMVPTFCAQMECVTDIVVSILFC